MAGGLTPSLFPPESINGLGSLTSVCSLAIRLSLFNILATRMSLWHPSPLLSLQMLLFPFLKKGGGSYDWEGWIGSLINILTLMTSLLEDLLVVDLFFTDIIL